jgi:hypothetical protein
METKDTTVLQPAGFQFQPKQKHQRSLISLRFAHRHVAGEQI